MENISILNLEIRGLPQLTLPNLNVFLVKNHIRLVQAPTRLVYRMEYIKTIFMH